MLLGEPVSMLVPQVVGFRLGGKLPEGATATDLVLAVTQILRNLGVVGKFVEYFGHGLVGLPLADRATIGNMSPEYGATCGFFPVDEETLRYLRLTGRSAGQVELVEAYWVQGLFHDPDATPEYSQVVELDLGDVEPSLAGPRRPQDRVPLTEAKASFLDSLSSFGVPYRNGSEDKAIADSFPASDPPDFTEPGHAPVPDAAPAGPWPSPTSRSRGRSQSPWAASPSSWSTAPSSPRSQSCTNTSNPSVMVAAGLLAKNAVERGLARKPWVKSSLAPGSKVVTEYYDKAGLTPFLEALGFHTVGYGCTTCIGNSGPLAPEISRPSSRARSSSAPSSPGTATSRRASIPR